MKVEIQTSIQDPGHPGVAVKTKGELHSDGGERQTLQKSMAIVSMRFLTKVFIMTFAFYTCFHSTFGNTGEAYGTPEEEPKELSSKKNPPTEVLQEPPTSLATPQASIPGFNIKKTLALIEKAYLEGEISKGRRHILRVKSVKHPQMLPARYIPGFSWIHRNLNDDDSTLSDSMPLTTETCQTPVMVEAYQALSGLKGAEQAKLKRLLLPPDDFEYYIQVDHPFPFRLSYADPEDETLAQVTAEAIQIAYDIQVTEWGFWEPIIETDAEYYRFFLADLPGGLGGYCAPYAENHDTPHRDAFSYIVLNKRVGYSGMLSLIAHEFNHACQVSMDVLEPAAFMENTSSFLETRIDPMSWIMKMYMIHIFQRNSHRPLEYMNYNGSDGYEYGGALWTYFLTNMYGDGEPQWLRMVWEGCVQEGMINEPDYFDVIDEMLAETGGFREMVKEFGRYRFFLGRDDDGQHLEGGYRFWDGEVSRIKKLNTGDLPIYDATPMEEILPMPNGCNYLTLDVDDTHDLPIRFHFSGEKDVDWYVTVMKIAEGEDTTYHDIQLDEDSSGSILMEGRVFDRMVGVICHLAPNDYDPDNRDWYTKTYTYSVDRVYPPPHIERVDPIYVVRGEQGQQINLFGDGFIDSLYTSVSFSGERVVGEFGQFVSSRNITISVTASKTAEKGNRDLIVTVPGGESTTLTNAIKVVDADEVPEDNGSGLEEGSKAGGCNCSYVKGSSSGESPQNKGVPTLLTLFLLAFLVSAKMHRRNRNKETSL